MLSCMRATLAIEKSRGERVSAITSMQLACHLTMCKKCSRYRRQSNLIEQLIRQGTAMEDSLSEKTKSRIHNEITIRIKGT